MDKQLPNSQSHPVSNAPTVSPLIETDNDTNTGTMAAAAPTPDATFGVASKRKKNNGKSQYKNQQNQEIRNNSASADEKFHYQQQRQHRRANNGNRKQAGKIDKDNKTQQTISNKKSNDKIAKSDRESRQQRRKHHNTQPQPNEENFKEQPQQQSEPEEKQEEEEPVLPGSYAVEGGDGSSHLDILDDYREEQTSARQRQQLQKEKSAFVVVAEVANDDELIRETENRVKNELIVNATHAEIMDDDDDDAANNLQKRKIIILGSLAFLVFIGIVVGVTIAATTDNGGNPNPVIIINSTASPTISLTPSTNPTMPPTIMPSARPSDKPSSMPSQKPSLRPSSKPSSPPTIAPTSPNNEFCENAISLERTNFVSGDLTFTQYDYSSLICDDDSGANVIDFGPSRWYSFSGSSNNLAILLCQSLFAAISTYIDDSCAEGTHCGELDDIQRFYRPEYSSDCPFQTLLITPPTLPGLTYRIMLSLPFDSTIGLPSMMPSLLIPSQYPLLPEYGSYSLGLTQSNYFCEGATDILLTSPITSGLDFVGSTLGARNVSEGQCGTATNENVPGVWYRIPGNDDIFEFSTCGSSSTHQISVYESQGLSRPCDILQCIVGSMDGCDNSVTWHAKEGITYYILVSSVTASGSSFTLKPSSARPAVFDCIGALMIDLSTFIPEDVFEFSYNSYVVGSDERTCLDIDLFDQKQGVWWKLEGNGDTWEVASCTVYSGSIGLSVFAGNNCDDIECVTSLAGCDYGNRGDSVSFTTEPGKMYYIRTYGDSRLNPSLFGFALIDIRQPLV